MTISVQGEEVVIRLAIPGAHNARNALAAAATGLAAGVSVAAVREGLERFSGVKGRLQRRVGCQWRDTA